MEQPVNHAGLEFRLIGGAFQPVAESYEKLKTVLELDEAWFAVTGIDIVSLRADQKFLEFLDSDKNGKIRTDEIKSAIAFMLEVLKDGSGYEKRSQVLSLSALNTESKTGAEILESARLVLHNLGKEDAQEISLDDIRDEKQIKSCVLCNGDGVITADDTAPELAEIINLAIAFGGGEADLSGNNGINEKLLDKFVEAVNTLLAWHKEADDKKEFCPFGSQTKDIYTRYIQIKEALDSFFLNSETLAFLDTDPDRLAKKDSVADVRSPAEVMDLLKKLAVAAPTADGKLDTAGALNPLWKSKIDAFFAFPEIQTYLEDAQLSSAAWQKLTKLLEPAGEWFKRCPDMPVLLKLSVEELKKTIAEENISRLRELIAKDLEAGAVLARLDTLHKLILFQCHMQEFLRCFLNLSDLFEPGIHSLLQTGTLIMDGRHFSLAVPVANLAEHKRIATDSNICVAYIEISRGLPTALKKQLLAVAITSGNMRNLFPGKRGIFFDTAGDVYDAKITDFIRQPVSIGEALKSPFYRLGEFLGKQADKMFSAKSAAAQQDLSKTIAAGKIPAVPAAPDPKQSQGINGSMLLMGGGIGLAAIGSSIAFIVKSLQNISIGNIVAILCGILLVFGGPIVVISLIKLYRRDLGRFLEASGCALNFPLRLSMELGNFFTMAPQRPLSSWTKGQLIAQSVVPAKKIRWTTWILFILLALAVAAWGILEYNLYDLVIR